MLQRTPGVQAVAAVAQQQQRNSSSRHSLQLAHNVQQQQQLAMLRCEALRERLVLTAVTECVQQPATFIFSCRSEKLLV